MSSLFLFFRHLYSEMFSVLSLSAFVQIRTRVNPSHGKPCTVTISFQVCLWRKCGWEVALAADVRSLTQVGAVPRLSVAFARTRMSCKR